MIGRRILVLCILFLLIQEVCEAQRRRINRGPDHRFEIGIVAGTNLSQIDGDFFTGFDLAGINTGLQVDALMSSRLRLTVGMHYSQKGAFTPHGTVVTPNTRNDRTLRLNYVEIPILFKAMLDKPESGPFFEIGGAVSRLSSTKIDELPASQIEGTIYNEILPEFNKNDINAVAGFGFTLGSRFSFTLRYHYSLQKIYSDPEIMPRNPFSLRAREVEFLRNYHFALLLSYRII